MYHRLRKLAIAVFIVPSVFFAPWALGNPPLFDTTEESLNAKIQMLQNSEGDYSIELYGPLRDLARFHLDSGNFDASLAATQHMQHIIRRNNGVWSPAQEESVSLMLSAYVAMGKGLDAERLNHFLYDIADRQYEDNEVGMHLARWRLGDWYRNTQRYEEAIRVYSTSRELLEQTRNVALLIPILQREALALFLAERCCAEDRLARAADLISDSPQFDYHEKREARLTQADLMMLTSHSHTPPVMHAQLVPVGLTSAPPRLLGLKHRQDVRAVAYDEPMRESPLAKTYRFKDTATIMFQPRVKLPPSIGYPVGMCSEAIREFLPMRKIDDIARLDVADLYIDVGLRVDTEGRPYDISLNGNAPGRLVKYVERVLKRSQYRPGMDEHGHLQDSELHFRQTFISPPHRLLASDLSTWAAEKGRHVCATLV